VEISTEVSPAPEAFTSNFLAAEISTFPSAVVPVPELRITSPPEPRDPPFPAAIFTSPAVGRLEFP